MKKKFPYVVLLALAILFVSTPAWAQTEYKLLAPLDGYVKTTEGGKVTAANYISGIFTLIIAVAGGLAVIMIVFGGIQYMSTDAFQGKSEAKNTISNAIWGLLLALSAWLILHTINPDLIKFDLRIPPPQDRTGTPPT